MTGQIEQYLEQELASLRQQLAEAKKDAERYRWLKPRMYVGVSRLKECLWCIDGLFENLNMTLDETIDAAIDQAMREGE